MPLTSIPAKGANAIEAAMFAVVFHEPFGQETLAGMRSAAESLAGELPGQSPLTTLTVNIGPGSVQTPQATPTGVMRSHTNPDGSPSWRLMVQANSIIQQCFTYTSWHEVGTRALRYYQTILAAVPNTMTVNEIGYQVVDRFGYEGGADISEYSIGEIFNTDSEFLPRHVLSAGPLWHVHQGWFERPQHLRTDAARLLHQVNLSSQKEAGSEFELTTVIDHRATFKIDRDSLTLGDVDLTMCLNELKNANQRLVSQMLTDQKLNSIGIRH